MDDHNAHRSTVGAVDRADDRAGKLIEHHRTDDRRHSEATADPWSARMLDRWLDARKARPAPRRSDRWVLSTPRPATFAELVELGAIDVDELAVPVSAADLGGGS